MPQERALLVENTHETTNHTTFIILGSANCSSNLVSAYRIAGSSVNFAIFAAVLVIFADLAVFCLFAPPVN